LINDERPAVPANRKTQPHCECPAPEAREPGPADAALAELAWAIAHPIRARILHLLIEKDICVCGELVELLPVAQSTVSQHLKIMKQAGLIQGEVDGPKVCYCVNPAGLARLKDLVRRL
jgi:ArsR family transcriptional regulator, arsenate/arsenite/antimonite-responsive transcriptional repressor